jgi:hypothetical protein
VQLSTPSSFISSGGKCDVACQKFRHACGSSDLRYSTERPIIKGGSQYLLTTTAELTRSDSACGTPSTTQTLAQHKISTSAAGEK